MLFTTDHSLAYFPTITYVIHHNHVHQRYQDIDTHKFAHQDSMCLHYCRGCCCKDRLKYENNEDDYLHGYKTIKELRKERYYNWGICLCFKLDICIFVLWVWLSISRISLVLPKDTFTNNHWNNILHTVSQNLNSSYFICLTQYIASKYGSYNIDQYTPFAIHTKRLFDQNIRILSFNSIQ